MDTNREVESIMMNVRNNTSGIIGLAILSVKAGMMLLTFFMRIAKKGVIAAGFVDAYKGFLEKTEGEYTVFNVPLSQEKAVCVARLQELECKLDTAKSALEKSRIRKEIRSLQNQLPDIEQLKKLKITHCVLPKINGSTNTIQIAVASSDVQPFKNWYLNHLTANLSGGAKELDELNAFTEGGYGIYNMPFEEEGIQEMTHDYDLLGVNYAILPDLKVGDGYIQMAVANTDREKVMAWFKMWKDRELTKGNPVKEMYAMTQDEYMQSGRTDEETYIQSAEKPYRDIQQAYEDKSERVPDIVKTDENEQYIQYLNDKSYAKITINRESLVDNMALSEVTNTMRKEGYFVSRMPGTYGANQRTLIVPMEQAFLTDEGSTYVVFIKKNQMQSVADANGKVEKVSSAEIIKPYDSVNRQFSRVENVKNQPIRRKPNTFNYQSKRTYDMDELEKKLIKASIPPKV